MKHVPLLPGESPMPSAPRVRLDDGTNCIPQHYLQYQHSLASVQDIVSEIDYDPHYLLFVDEDNTGIFIQVGIVGVDNYIHKAHQQDQKIVYARRWRVEPSLPSSEIIQTAFLALMKAREHEIRELVKLDVEGKKTTPFSCHHDLPLMAMSAKTNTQSDQHEFQQSDLHALIARLSYDDGVFDLAQLHPLSNQSCVLTLHFTPSHSTSLPELMLPFDVHIVLEELHEDTFLYSLMDALLLKSNQHVEANFTFKDFARFSRKNSVSKIAHLSAKTRHKGLTESNHRFQVLFKQSNYDTDETRVPTLDDSKLGQKLKQQMHRFSIATGILPRSKQSA